MKHGCPIRLRAFDVRRVEEGMYEVVLAAERIYCEELTRSIEELDIEETCKISMHKACNRILHIDALTQCIVG